MPIRLACSRGHALMAPERLAGRTLPCPKCGELVSIPGDPVAQAITERPSAASADAVFGGRDSVAKRLAEPVAKVATTARLPEKPDQVEKREGAPADKPKAIPALPFEPIDPVKPQNKNEVAHAAPVDQAKAIVDLPRPASKPPLPVPAVTTDVAPVKAHPASPSKPPAPVEKPSAPTAIPRKPLEPPPNLPAAAVASPPPAPPSSPVEVKSVATASAVAHAPTVNAPTIELLGEEKLLTEEDDFDPAEFVLKLDADGQASPYGHRKAAGVLVLTGLTLLVPTIWPLSQSRQIDVLALPHWVFVLWLLALLDVAYALLLAQVTHRYSRLTTAGYLTLAAGFWAALACIAWLGRSEHPLLTILELNDPFVRRAALFLSVVSSAIHGVIACYSGMLGEDE